MKASNRASQVRLRPYTRDDRQALSALFSDAEVVRYVADGRPLDPSAAAQVLDKILIIYETDPSFLIWAVQEGDEYVGHAELKRRKGRSEYEIIYILERRRWGRSLGGKVADLLIEEARERSISFIIATVYPENLASVAILIKRGFELDVELSDELDCHAYKLNLT